MSVQSADDVLKEANSLFVDEDYESALKKFNEAIDMDDSNSDYYAKRSFCHHKLSDHAKALKDALKSIELDPSNSVGHFRVGMAAFSLEDYVKAHASFTKANELKPSQQNKTWIRKCEVELESAGSAKPAPQPTPAATPAPTKPKLVSTPIHTPAPISQQAPPAVAPATDASKIRHEWFQTATHVTVCIMSKGTKKENCTVNIQNKELNVTIKLVSGSEYQLNLELAGEVVPAESRFEILSTKVEIKMKKASAAQWNTLEDTGEKLGVWSTVQDGPSKGLAYPSSARKHSDWDKIAPEEDKLEGDAALNQVFQGIFKNGSDEQRMAMQKSFLESGGTVLSTNWDEVGKGEVKGSAPNGMEMKSWSDLSK